MKKQRPHWKHILDLNKAHSSLKKFTYSLNISIWGELTSQVLIPWLVWYFRWELVEGEKKIGRICLKFFRLRLALYLRFSLIFWYFMMGRCYIQKQVFPLFYSQTRGNEKIPFWVTKRDQSLIWRSVSDPRPTSCIWLHLFVSWIIEFHIVHWGLSFDAILRVFFVVR